MGLYDYANFQQSWHYEYFGERVQVQVPLNEGFHPVSSGDNYKENYDVLFFDYKSERFMLK